MTKRSLGRNCVTSFNRLQSVTEGSQNRSSSSAVACSRNHRGVLLTGVPPLAHVQPAFLYVLPPRVGTAYSFLGPPTSVSNQETCHRLATGEFDGGSSSAEALPPR